MEGCELQRSYFFLADTRRVRMAAHLFLQVCFLNQSLNQVVMETEQSPCLRASTSLIISMAEQTLVEMINLCKAQVSLKD